MNLSNFGSKLKISRDKSAQEREIFINIIDTFEQCWLRTNFIQTQLGIDFYNYEEHYFSMIEDLIFLKYGDTAGTLILWYVYDRFDKDGSLLSIDVSINEKPKKQYKLKTSLDLWNLVDKIIKINK
jgi:hypothetical protein